MENTRRADLHLHSSFSYDVPDLECFSPRALFEKALAGPDPARRVDFFALTDHDTMAGYRELVRDLPEADRRLVIPAVEHTLRDPGIGFAIHVNLYGLDPDTYARLRREVVTLDDLLGYCRDHLILAQYNHPAWFVHAEVRRGQVDFGKVPAIAERFDVLELNAGRPPALNAMTRSLAGSLGKILTANSDSHSGDIGLACNLAAGETAEAFLHNIWQGRGKVLAADTAHAGMLKVMHDLIDAVLDERDCREVVASVLPGRYPRLERLVLGLLGSPLVREPGTGRESLRLVLKQLSRPVVRSWLRQENVVAREFARAMQDQTLLAEQVHVA